MGKRHGNGPEAGDIASGADVRVGFLEVEGERLAVMSYGAVQSASWDELTPAEADVVELVVRGRSNREIAEARGTSPTTVANQLSAVFRKLGVNSRSDLVAHLFGTPSDREG